jgi:hypothetical protein
MALTPCRLHLLLPENDTKAYVLQEAFFFKKLKEKERSNIHVFKATASHVLA